MFQEIAHHIWVFTEEVNQSPMGAECRALGDGFLNRRRQFVRFKVLVILSFLGNLQLADHSAPWVHTKATGVALGIHHFFREEGFDFLRRGFGVKREDQALISVETISLFKQLENLEPWWPICHFTKVHGSV